MSYGDITPTWGGSLLPQAWITADLDPYAACSNGLGKAWVKWSVGGPQRIVEVRVGSPNGTPMVRHDGTSQASAWTGCWVTPGTVFYLVDVASNQVLAQSAPSPTLASVVTPATQAAIAQAQQAAATAQGQTYYQTPPIATPEQIEQAAQQGETVANGNTILGFPPMFLLAGVAVAFFLLKGK